MGVKKCGTLALNHFLNFHPQVSFKNNFHGEGHYFDIGCRGKTTAQCVSDKNMIDFAYLVLKKNRLKYSWISAPNFITEKGSFSNADPKIIVGERSPNYLIESAIPSRIKKYNPNIKVVIMVCEPAARAYSDFIHFSTTSTSRPDTKLLG